MFIRDSWKLSWSFCGWFAWVCKVVILMSNPATVEFDVVLLLNLGFWQWLGCDHIVISLFRLKMTEGVSVSPLFNSRRLVPSSNPLYHISKAHIPDLNICMMWCQYFTPALFLHPCVELPYSPSHTCLVCSAPQRGPGTKWPTPLLLRPSSWPSSSSWEQVVNDRFIKGEK